MKKVQHELQRRLESLGAALLDAAVGLDMQTGTLVSKSGDVGAVVGAHELVDQG
ncbi:MAG: hypothetical protein H6641_16075 [Caldilineaceae bacterium]|nr:hypothetical protein [Caldilineaceae bacterium]